MSNTFNEEAKELQVTVVDSAQYGLNAEAQAMLSALCSRSKEGPRGNLNKVMEKGADAFMEKVYLSYGHSSVGKLGSSKLFISGISMIAINHLQNLNPLYKGQESSTRYITFSGENIVVPESIKANPKALEIYETMTGILMAAYDDFCEKVLDHLIASCPNPDPDNISETKWLNTLKARRFDICRSMLPAGCKTVGVWDGTLEEFKDHINILHNHHNPEVVAMAKELGKAIKEAYPNSFSDDFPVTNPWLAKSCYMLPKWTTFSDEVQMSDWAFDTEGFNRAARENEFWTVGRYDRLPDWVGKFGNLNFTYATDFGSFRDLNRHRKGVIQRTHILPGTMNEWYVESLEAAGIDLTNLLDKVYGASEALAELGIPTCDIEYMQPMGSMVIVEGSYPIDNALYLSHLRSGKTVHETARKVAIGMLNCLKTICNFPVYGNTDTTDSLDAKRGDQTITIKE